MRTAKNLVTHELIGLKVSISTISNPYVAKIRGKIVGETRNMFIIEKKSGDEVKIAKDGNVFVFELDNKKVEIDGKILVGRPEDRIKKKFKKW